MSLVGLHRSEGKRQWEDIPPHEWNISQRIAEATNSIGTLATATTIGSAIALEKGMRLLKAGEHIKSLSYTAAAFGGDALDGFLAEFFKVKSPFGRDLDATVDKFKMARALFTYHKEGVVEPKVTRLFLAQGLGNTALSFAAKFKDVQLNPSLEGKALAGCQATTLLSSHAAFAFEKEGDTEKANTFQSIADKAFDMTKLLWLPVADNYRKQVFVDQIPR